MTKQLLFRLKSVLISEKESVTIKDIFLLDSVDEYGIFEV